MTLEHRLTASASSQFDASEVARVNMARCYLATTWLFLLVLLPLSKSQFFSARSDDEDLFSSVAKMEDLVEQEKALIDLLESYVDSSQKKLEVVKRYIANCRQDLGPNVVSSQLVANPVDAFLLLKKLTIDWEAVESVIKTGLNETAGTLNAIELMRFNSVLPKTDDLNGAAVALVKLQDTYRLDVTELARGHVYGLETSPKKIFQSRQDLTGRDCFFVAQHAFASGYYDTALQWGQAALHRADLKTTDNATDLKREVNQFLRDAAQTHDDILERQGPRGLNWQTNLLPVNRQLVTAHSDQYSSLAEYRFAPKLYQLQTEDEEKEHYKRLCRGEKLRSPLLDSSLRCHLTHRNNAYLLLQPLKVEEHSLDPKIVVFHDLLSEHQTDLLMQLAKPKLSTSKHKGETGFVRSLIRTSKNAWLSEAENSSLPAIRLRVELATGLIAGPETAAERFQIANYGIGGLYAPHTDNLIHDDNPNPWELVAGDRIATFMVYLSDVEAGGATVFPRAGVTLWPRRGSAAFWWNLYRKGDADASTRHGACPVLHGSKWVFNKWIRQYDQMFRAPCGLHPLDKFNLL